MEVVTVVVPDGLAPGDEFVVSANGREFNVTVPDGVWGGVSIDLELPVAEAPGSSASQHMQQVVVTVPDGVSAGQLFTVDFGGQLFEVTVPDGLVAGDELEIELPAPPSLSSKAPPPPTASQGGVGWDDWDSAWEPVPKGSTGWADAPEPAPYYGRYKIGEKVQVQRTSGEWSPATIKEYDELSDTCARRALRREGFGRHSHGSSCIARARRAPPSFRLPCLVCRHDRAAGEQAAKVYGV